jgi:DNA-binding transcriptional MerR regulator
MRLTVGQLADAAGMTVRNVRNHQSRGLLPPPDIEARTGYYGERHLERLRLIQEMQADGYNLEAIRRLLSGSELRRVATMPAEEPEVLTAEELARRFGSAGGAALAEAERLGVLRALGDGRFEAASPALLRGAEEAVARGLGLDAALRVVAEVRESCGTMARTFVELFQTERLGAGDDPVAAVESLRPVAARTVAALFDQAMAAEAARALSEPARPG